MLRCANTSCDMYSKKELHGCQHWDAMKQEHCVFIEDVLDMCPECKSTRIDPCGRGGKRCCKCGCTYGAD